MLDPGIRGVFSAGDIGRAVLANLHGPRRPRVGGEHLFGGDLQRDLSEHFAGRGRDETVEPKNRNLADLAREEVVHLDHELAVG